VTAGKERIWKAGGRMLVDRSGWGMDPQGWSATRRLSEKKEV